MRRRVNRNIGLLGAALAVLTVSLLLQFVSFNSLGEKGLVRRFQKTFRQKELLLYSLMEDLEEGLKDVGRADYFTVLYPRIQGRIEGRGMDLFLFRKDSLVLWTGNKVSPADFEGDGEREILFLGNNWSVKKERVSGDFRIVGLIKLKNEYPYENIFLENRFQEDFRLPPGAQIMVDSGGGGQPILDSWQKELFALDFSEVPKYSLFQSQLSLVLYFLGIYPYMINSFEELVNIMNICLKHFYRSIDSDSYRCINKCFHIILH